MRFPKVTAADRRVAEWIVNNPKLGGEIVARLRQHVGQDAVRKDRKVQLPILRQVRELLAKLRP